jgi:hypothetical protein
MAAMGSLDAYDFGLEAGVETFLFGTDLQTNPNLVS